MKQRCCIIDEGGPLGVGIQVLISNYLSPLCLRGMGVSRQEKWHSMLHVRIMETNVRESLLKCREVENDVKTNHSPLDWDKPRSYLITDLGGVRHLGGVNIIQAIIRNLGSSRSDVKGEIQVVDTIRMRVPMLSTVTDQPVVAMKSSKVDGAKGLSYSVLRFGQLILSGGINE